MLLQVLIAILCAHGVSGDCDLSGNWIAIHFTSFDVQTYSVVTITQSPTRAVSVSCNASAAPCPWKTASGAIANVSLMLSSDKGDKIEGMVHRNCDIITTGIPEHVSANWLRVDPSVKKVRML